MDARAWHHATPNEAIVHAVNEGSERLELSSADPSFVRALVYNPDTYGHVTDDKNSSVTTETKKTTSLKSACSCTPTQNSDVSGQPPSVVILTPTKLNLEERSLISTGDRKRGVSDMDYGYEGLSMRTDRGSMPGGRKRWCPALRRNSVVIHRRQGGNATLVQEMLKTSMNGSLLSGETETTRKINLAAPAVPFEFPGSKPEQSQCHSTEK